MCYVTTLRLAQAWFCLHNVGQTFLSVRSCQHIFRLQNMFLGVLFCIKIILYVCCLYAKPFPRLSYSGTSIYRSRNDHFPTCTVHHFWSRMKFHINNVIYSRIHRSPNYCFTALIVCKSRSWRSISCKDRLKKKLKRCNYYLSYLSLDYRSGNTVMQSCFARGAQLRVRVISIISELYFVASGSVFSHVISSIWFICFH